MGGKSSKGIDVAAEKVVTPAVAKSIDEETQAAQKEQAEQRNRLRGVSSTYMRNGGSTGGKTKLGE